MLSQECLSETDICFDGCPRVAPGVSAQSPCLRHAIDSLTSKVKSYQSVCLLSIHVSNVAMLS